MTTSTRIDARSPTACDPLSVERCGSLTVVKWNWIRLDLDESKSTTGEGYPTRLDDTAPMRPQIETLVDHFPDRQPAAHQ